MADISGIVDLYDLFILQEPRVGQRAEFDWGEVTLSIDGTWQKLNLAVFVLPFSLYRFACLYHRSTHLEVVQAHIDFFREIGSVPESIIYDRMATVYDSQKGQLNDKFLELSMHFGFRPSSAILLRLTRRVQTKRV